MIESHSISQEYILFQDTQSTCGVLLIQNLSIVIRRKCRQNYSRGFSLGDSLSAFQDTLQGHHELLFPRPLNLFNLPNLPLAFSPVSEGGVTGLVWNE